ncbi:hypothetical protein BT96DRAFT_711254 [Gymnopus androsaceus JB14]|uniref:Uncharacterized protein n=1 Tax=Gymnopus androsaceus JB14 TaxID=1447944 RepID=A0A6A4GEI2_9AGAR|nr:hypothetical protein BT96DRAFT_711254 [Gymnopus androsaceus JB14]
MTIHVHHLPRSSNSPRNNYKIHASYVPVLALRPWPHASIGDTFNVLTSVPNPVSIYPGGLEPRALINCTKFKVALV